MSNRTRSSAGDGDTRRADRSRDWRHKGKARDDTPDPRVYTVLPSVEQGHIGVCNMVAALDSGVKGVYALTLERIGTIATALRRAGFKPTEGAEAER